jgi:putative tryptophan/tyrosine transport system substrate-binding protein
MRRREFTILLASAGLGWPLRASAQRANKLPTIGFLGPSTAGIASERTAAFEHRLRELGWDDGRSVRIEYKWADGRAERFGKIADQFVLDNVDVIVTWGTATAVAAKRSTSSVPIIFTIVGDPVGSGLVASLARPGANVTGLSTQHADAAGKRLQLIKEVLPDLSRLAIMANIENSGGVLEMHEAKVAARKLGIEPKMVPIRRGEDISAAMEALKGQADALYVAGDALFNTNRVRVNMLALAASLPSIHGHREIVEAGGLMSYGPDYLDLFRRTAEFVNKILRGAKPEDIPVEQPTKFELVTNQTTAKALKVTVPPTLLARADEVIE